MASHSSVDSQFPTFFGGLFGWDLGRPETIWNCFSISPETQEEGGRRNGTSKKRKRKAEQQKYKKNPRKEKEGRDDDRLKVEWTGVSRLLLHPHPMSEELGGS